MYGQKRKSTQLSLIGSIKGEGARFSLVTRPSRIARPPSPSSPSSLPPSLSLSLSLSLFVTFCFVSGGAAVAPGLPTRRFNNIEEMPGGMDGAERGGTGRDGTGRPGDLMREEMGFEWAHHHDNPQN